MSNAAKYTQEQLDIAVLKTTNEGIFRTFSSIETQLSDFKSELTSIRSEMKSQSHFNMGLTLGIYAMIGAAALSKIFGLM